jgi:methyl-accepting chemotaxis protein
VHRNRAVAESAYTVTWNVASGTLTPFWQKEVNEMNLKFSHKILLAASGVVVLAFALFTFYNDYLQRNTIRQNLESSIQQSGELTASSVQNWLSGRVLVLESLAQNVAHQGSSAGIYIWWRKLMARRSSKARKG